MFPSHLGYDGSKAFGAEVVDTLEVVQVLQLLKNMDRQCVRTCARCVFMMSVVWCVCSYMWDAHGRGGAGKAEEG